MSFWQDFKAFAIKGNVIDLAVGVIIGNAFGKIVSSLVSDVIMPPLGLVIGGVDFSKLAITLKDPLLGHEPVILRYGMFLQNVFDFMIIAFAIFAFVSLVNRFRAQTPPPTPKQEILLTEIRDLLKDQVQHTSKPEP